MKLGLRGWGTLKTEASVFRAEAGLVVMSHRGTGYGRRPRAPPGASGGIISRVPLGSCAKFHAALCHLPISGTGPLSDPWPLPSRLNPMTTLAPPLPHAHFSVSRAAVVLVTLLVGFVALLGRVTYLQTEGRHHTLARAERQQHNTQILRARRGSIYDRNGIEMAGSVQQESLFVDPHFMQQVFSQDGKSLVDMDRAVTKLAHLVEKDPFTLSQLLSDRFESRYVRVADQIDDQTAQAIARLDLPGAGL